MSTGETEERGNSRAEGQRPGLTLAFEYVKVDSPPPNITKWS